MKPDQPITSDYYRLQFRDVLQHIKCKQHSQYLQTKLPEQEYKNHIKSLHNDAENTSSNDHKALKEHLDSMINQPPPEISKVQHFSINSLLACNPKSVYF